MKLYRVTYRDDSDFHVAEWCSSKAKAKQLIAEAKRNNENWRDKQDAITYEVVEFKTDVDSMVRFLNNYASNAGQ